jgi:pimeloyl-ACP methyl ester carboxylesterase
MPTLDRHGVAIAYEVHGPGHGGAAGATGAVPLLLSHGYSASSAMWNANIAALAADRRVVTWDIRGHGHSDSPTDPGLYSEEASVADMAAVLDACGIERAAVAGLSLGGYLSLAFHLAHPRRVAALLLFDTGPGYKRDDARQGWNTWAESTAATFETKGLAALSGSPEVGTGPHDPTGLALSARGILTQRDARVIESLPSIAVPTLVLVGVDDTLFLGPADYMAAKIPGATKAVIPQAGHASNIDNPPAFDEAVTTFLAASVGPATA